MAKYIKTRSPVKNIKILDKPANLSKRMKDNFIRTKERAEETQNSRHASPSEYASENIQDTAQGAARDTVYHLPNPRQKARDNLNRAKEHFAEVKNQMPRERQHAAEQAQKTAHKTKTNAENLRKSADKAGETAQQAKAAVKDAKNTLREVRQSGRQTLREVKQGARLERLDAASNVAHGAGWQKKPSDLQRKRGIKRLMQQKTANTAPKTAPIEPINTPIGTPKGGLCHPNYLDKAITAPKNTGDTVNTLQSSAKSTGKAVKSTKKGFKETAKGTIKTAKKSIKTAEQSAKAAVKTAQQTAKTAKAAERAARAAAKTAARTAKIAAKAVTAMVKAAIAAVKGLVAAIAAGGWIAVMIILIVCLIGMLLGSVFGIFFSSEDGASENGITMNAVVAQIDAEFSGELERIIADNPHDDYDITGVCAEWKEILAVYAVKTNTDADNPLDVMTLDDEKIELLRTVFWDMNIITYWTEEIEHEAEDEDDEDWTEYILHITVTSKTAAEMATQYGFNAKHREMLDELLKPEYDSLWSAVLADALEGGPNRTHDHIAELLAGDDTTFVGGGFTSPIAGNWRSMVSCEFGTGYAGHTGMDIAIPIGTEIQAVAAGKVLYTKMSSSGYGYHVVINHGGGIVTLYAHCSRILVSAGQEVSQGDVIALSGNTGNVSPRPTPANPTAGAHLHLEFIVDGLPKNPRSYLS